MSFVNPYFLWGAVATAVPVLIHLIRRESSEKVEFPTLMFLRRIDKRVIRYQKLRHLLLLLLRVLTILLLVLAFMRPFRDIPQASASTAGQAESHIILVDDSLSMAYGDRWERARTAAAGIIRSARPGDRVALLEFSDRTTIRSEPTSDVRAVLAELGNLSGPTDLPTRYGQALKAAEGVALDAPGRRTIHLISDFQKSGWAADERDFRLSPGIALDGVDVGSDEYSNLALGDVRILGEGGDSGSVTVRFSVVDFGTEDRKGVKVGVSIDGHRTAEKAIDVARGGVAAVEFQLPAPEEGAHDLVLEVEDARLPRDDRFFLTMERRGKIPVLSVENPGGGRDGRAPSFFLSNALNIPEFSPYRLATTTPQRFQSSPGAGAGLLVWNNVPAGAAAERKLENFVRSGGGLAVVVADSRAAADFNSSFGSWLPVRAEAAARSGEARWQDFVLLTDLRLDNPIFRPFGEPHSGNFSSAKFFDHVRLAPGDGVEVPARFDNGDPALVTAAVGKGRAAILPFTVDDSSNDLPIKAVYAPFWHQILHYLENFHQRPGWIRIGETFAPGELLAEAALRQGGKSLDSRQAVVVLDPGQERVASPPGGAVAADRAGFYEIRSPAVRATIAVNTPAEESDLAHGDAEEMTAGWISREAQSAAPVPPDERLTAEQQDRKQRVWAYLLIGVLVFFLAEGILSNRSVLKPE